MGLYRHKGSKVWWISITRNGQRIRKSTETDNKQKAIEVEAKIRTMMVEDKWFGTDEAKLRTFFELVDQYVSVRSTQKEPKSKQRDIASFKNMKAFFGNCTLANITPARISAYKQVRLQVVDPQTVVKELGTLKHAFNLAIREWEWCKENPVMRVAMPPIPPGRTRYLTNDEFILLFENAEEWYKPILLVAVHTGMRKGNLISLRWEQVDLEKQVVILTKTKNKTPLAIPINSALLATLKDQKAEAARGKVTSIRGLVFFHDGRPLNSMLLTRALKRACLKCGIEDFRFHDLRHTFASILVQKGTSLYVVQKLLGHKDGRMTQRYAHLAPEQFADAVEVMNRFGQKSVRVGEKEKELQAATP